MASPDLQHLRIYEAPVPAATVLADGDAHDMAGLTEAFTEATGCPLSFAPGPAPETTAVSTARHRSFLAWSAPVDPGVGAAPGHLRIECDATGGARPHVEGGDGAGSSNEPRHNIAAAVRLAEHLASMTNQLEQTRVALRSATAELAVAAPIVSYVGRGAELGARLEAVLQGGAEALDCSAAVAYLLDESTSELRLRAHWGLAPARVAQPARELEGCTADLEAMLGSAVVLEDNQLYDLWHVPEPSYGAAVCVPISSSSTVLGTFWVFSDELREFAARDTNLIEILAGRVAVELEREALLAECRGRIRPT